MAVPTVGNDSLKYNPIASVFRNCRMRLTVPDKFPHFDVASATKVLPKEEKEKEGKRQFHHSKSFRRLRHYFLARKVALACRVHSTGIVSLLLARASFARIIPAGARRGAQE